MSPKILHSLFSKLCIFLELNWSVLKDEGWVTAIVVTGKVVKLDLIAFIGLRCISHWRCVLWKIGLFGLSGYCMDCIRCGLDSVANCIFLLKCIGLSGYRLDCNGCGLHFIRSCMFWLICVGFWSPNHPQTVSQTVSKVVPHEIGLRVRPRAGQGLV